MSDDVVLADGDTLVLSGKPGALAIAIEHAAEGLSARATGLS